jgi:hypothetical protein
MEGQIKYYPVGNGDQSLISIKENDATLGKDYTTNILIDCNIRESCKGNTDTSQCDVKADLLKSLSKRNGMPYVDVFILTHGDQDHCRGFEANFYQGDPRKYGEKNKKLEEIFIDVLWFSPMALEESGNPDAECYRKEAKRRIKLHNDDHPDKDLPGNKIVIVGYNGNESISDLNTKRVVPGTVVTKFNERELSTFSIFIHAPYKAQLAEVDDRNHTSIVFQTRFRKNLQMDQFAVLAMFGGDADYIAWDIILQKTIKYNNEGALEWDLFLAPHHCSWTFFNESSNKDEPKDSSLLVLKYRRENGMIISSSKKILNDDKNPPSYQAKQQYLKVVDKSSQFLNTDVEPNEEEPLPIVFRVTENGPSRLPTEEVKNAMGSAGGSGAASTIISQGQ